MLLVSLVLLETLDSPVRLASRASQAFLEFKVIFGQGSDIYSARDNPTKQLMNAMAVKHYALPAIMATGTYWWVDIHEHSVLYGLVVGCRLGCCP